MNELSKETSPYLLQHADNPVDWHPWGEEALALARRLDMPILLSIGYSACHWCHVMAHESFEDEETARLMNEYFINIKVDREERPDLDKIYQTAHYLLTQRNGGWPLTLFLTPEELIPFYAGTYFPPESRQGLPGFRELLQGVAGLYRNRLDEVKQQGAALQQALQQTFRQSLSPVEMGPQLLDQAKEMLAEYYDPAHGGFGKAPKFPHPTNLERLLRHWLASRDSKEGPDLKALEMLAFSLKKMALGGINDQIGGGFCRYSVDDVWMIPHFEKMLYDNGPLLALYSQAAITTGSDLFRRIATETGNWVLREMQSPEGGYYSSLDADSEGEEGKFYVWTREEALSLLSDEEYQLFAYRFGLNRPANFEGKWFLHVYHEYEAMEKHFSRPEFEIRQIIDMARNKLLAARSGRVWPGKDEKILTSWNGLMIRGMTIAGRLLGQPEFTDSAEQALDFIRRELWVDGRLLATSKDGRSHLMAYLDDYAYLIDAIIEMLQNHWSSEHLSFAMALADTLLEHFEDPHQGGFHFTADDHEQLLERPKPYADDAMPAGNAIAALALSRLGYLCGESRYLDAASRCLLSASGLIAKAPIVHCGMLSALEEQLTAPQIVIIRGEAPELEEWAMHARQHYRPTRLCFAIPDTATSLPTALAGKTSRDGDPIAYICQGPRCAPPVTDVAGFANFLQAID